MTEAMLRCRDERRRALVRRDECLNGLDYLEVSPDQRSLTVYFLDKAPEDLVLGNLRVTGGRRITDIRVTEFSVCANEDPERDDCLTVRLDRPGDFSCYRLEIVEADAYGYPTSTRHHRFDPRYYALEFSFKVDCPSDLDCLPAPCPPPAWPQPDIRYLAKDYQSFTDLLLDRMAVLVPDWRERSAADMYVMLLEVLAYVGDHLSYRQDAIATEAYLTTARLRTSVRRHARLVDYRMHEGASARVWVVVESTKNLDPPIAFVTDLSALLPHTEPMMKPSALERISPDEYLWYEPVESVRVRAARSVIHFYTWGDGDCCLPTGTTAATLVDVCDENGASALGLAPGDVLVFEEILGPATGVPGDADLSHRHAVRLTEVRRDTDPLTHTTVVEIRWGTADALPFPLCLSAIGPPPACAVLDPVSVAYGNVILADHGRTTREDLPAVPVRSSVEPCRDGCPDPPVLRPGPFRPALTGSPLSYRTPFASDAPAAAIMLDDPRSALPQLRLSSRLGDTDADWAPRADLLDSGPGDRHVVVETDDEAVAHLRFGDDTLGRAPAAGEQFSARYRVGAGPAGNVGPDAVRHLLSDNLVSGARVRLHNPLPAVGGLAPESVTEVKKFAPHAMRRDRRRAITPADYAELTMRDFPARVQRAAGEQRWTGSWYEMRVAVDVFGAFDPCPDLLAAIAARLDHYRRIGHDVAVRPAINVGLEVDLTVCVADGYRRADIARILHARLGNRRLADGTLGMFHPDAVTFGATVAASTLVAVAAAIPGVGNARVTRLRRYGQSTVPADVDDLPADGLLPLRPMEIPRLDNDPAAPEHGILRLDLRGGR
ncbi:putative phage baseplate assembly protein [Nocardia tenerifensis]|uniref:Putative phage baseplate assembly protein n=1 Tax=Nocardia tenerifensis TaxID=228006 RepID=A0A318K0Z1_9NOCA|nr:putative baseplate assembly protein [Nocardia tenerifensis]PXX60815.1 putative phage baseplate assembly protein [Nocardia tenerifensis]